MYNRRRIIGLIPARGGSKGLPRKNVLPLLGKPLIAWTIEQALASSYLDTVIVSTDDREIADVAQQYGADVPFMRPRELASDTAKSIDVIIHATEYFKKSNSFFDYLMLLEPTSPLRETSDIDECIRILTKREDAQSIVSVAKLEGGHPDFNVVIEKQTGFIRRMSGSADFVAPRRQDLTDVYFFDGTIYCSKVDSLIDLGTFYHAATLAYPVPKWKSIEIDDKSDLICAEALLRARRDCILL